MTVTDRIKMIKSLVPLGTRLLDVGSDHALLPISLFKDGVIKGAVITDVNKGPLERSKQQVALLAPGLAKSASFVLSDGFAAVEMDSYDVAAICGMGGELIARIIADGGPKAHTPLILQPMSQADKLRAYLWTNGFVITDELYTTEGDRVYTAIATHYTGQNTPYSYNDLYLGKSRPGTAAYKAYCQKQAATAAKRLLGAPGDGRLRLLIEEAGKLRVES